MYMSPMCRYAKALIQVMAASEAKCSLAFHDIQGDEPDTNFLPRLQFFLNRLESQGATVGQLYAAMLLAGERARERGGGGDAASTNLLDRLVDMLQLV